MVHRTNLAGAFPEDDIASQCPGSVLEEEERRSERRRRGSFDLN